MKFLIGIFKQNVRASSPPDMMAYIMLEDAGLKNSLKYAKRSIYAELPKNKEGCGHRKIFQLLDCVFEFFDIPSPALAGEAAGGKRG